MFTTNLQIHIVTCCIHLRIHHTSRIPYLFHSFSEFVVDVLTTLIFSEKSEAMCQFFDNRGYPASVVQAGHHRAQQIDRQSALQTTKKENTDRISFTLTFHPHNYAVKCIILKNLKSLQNDSGTGTIFSQPPLILFITSKLALLFPSVLTSAFHSINLFMFSRHLIPTTSVAPISACKPTHNLQFLLTKG